MSAPAPQPSIPDSARIHLQPTYKDLCDSYRAIDDFRTKLLAALPVVTGAGIFFSAKGLDAKYLPGLGVFGFMVTLGLFALELYGILKCAALIKTGERLEDAMGMVGQFRTRPRPLLGQVDEVFASGLIYPAALGAWSYIGLAKWGAAAVLVAAGILVAGFAGSLRYKWWLKDYVPPGLK